MGFDWSDYVRRRDAAWPMGIFVLLSDEEVAAFRRGDNPPAYRGPAYGSHNPAFGAQKAPSGMGEQPSIINRDPGDESRALVLPAPSKTLLELIQGLEATVAGIRADLDRLVVAFAALDVGGTGATAASTPPHNHMANALAHSEPKPAWPR